MENINALIGKLSIHQFTNRQTQSEITDWIKAERGMDDESGEFIAPIFPRAMFQPVTKQATKIRNTFKAKTLPWEPGKRLFPESIHETVIGMVEPEIEKFNALVSDHVIGNWDHWLAEAERLSRQDKNAAHVFDPASLPTPEALAQLFAVDFIIEPLANPAAFNKRMRALFGAQFEQAMEKQMEQAMNAVWQKMIKPVSDMAERLSKPDAVFRDSLVKNIRDLVDEIPALNMTNDPALAQAAKEIETLLKIDPDTLRANGKVRNETAKQAAKLAAKFQKAERKIRVNSGGGSTKSTAPKKRKIRIN